MRLPNKLISYNESTLSLLPKILVKLKNGPVEVTYLYRMMRFEIDDPTDFLSAMDCLYALRTADIDERGMVYLC